MRIILLPLLACILIYSSCKQRNTSSSAPAPADTTVVPQALQENNGSSASYISKGKRGYGDLVNELYEELKAQNPSLQQLEKNIDRVKTEKEDSSEAFNEYNQKSNDYYSSANRHLESIKDTTTRERIKALILASMSRYESMASANKDLLVLLNRKDITLDDLYTAMKLTRTMEMIEKFQRQNLPSTKPLEKVNKEFDKVIPQL
jgi:cell shape-determining protein MreC